MGVLILTYTWALLRVTYKAIEYLSDMCAISVKFYQIDELAAQANITCVKYRL